MKPTAIITVISAFLAFCSTALANDLLVPTQYPTIQSAIDAAVDGDTVIIAPGTYTNDGNRDIDFLGKAITVRSTDPNDPNIVAATIIDCNGISSEPHRGFTFHTSEGPNSVLTGLTIINGYRSGYSWSELNGGAIYCNGSSPTISNCTVKNNSAAKYGGALYCEQSSPIITSCSFSDNHAITGGGIYCYYNSNPILTNCTISRNSSADRLGGGGGMYNYYSSPKLINCVFVDNSAEYDDAGSGGGVYNYNSNSTLINCSFSGNSARDGGGGIINRNSNPMITNCTFTNNSIGGIFNCGGSPKITNCIIAGNSAENLEGGGIYCLSDSSIITNCIITDNSAGYGGGIYCYGGNATITNSTITGNTANQYGGGIYCNGSSPTITNSILWGNTAKLGGEQITLFGYRYASNYYPSVLTISYSDAEGGFAEVYIQTGSSVIWKLGNIDVDPCFVNADANDYHLSSASTCINTGDPNYAPGPNETDLDGLPRIIGGRVDMGAYEFNHQPVAVAGPNQTIYAWIDGFADVNLDGSASSDDDNDVLDYYWSWTINGNTYEANGVNPAITLPVGNHTIELIVDDGLDLSEPNYCTITVIKAVRGKLMLNPQVIQTKSCGKWIIATLFILPVPGEQINKEQPLRLYPLGIEAQYQRFYRYGFSRCAPTFAIAFFDKQQVIDALGLGTTKISVVGEFQSGRFFFGSDTLKIISPKPPNHWRW